MSAPIVDIQARKRGVRRFTESTPLTLILTLPVRRQGRRDESPGGVSLVGSGRCQAAAPHNHSIKPNHHPRVNRVVRRTQIAAVSSPEGDAA